MYLGHRKVGMVYSELQSVSAFVSAGQYRLSTEMAKVSKAERHAKAKDLAKLVHVWGSA